MTTTTRSSAKKEDGQDSTAPPASEAEPGTKHKPDEDDVKDEHANKRAKPSESDEKVQKTIEETLERGNDNKEKSEADNETKDEPKSSESTTTEKPEREGAVEPQGRENDPSSDPVPSSILEKGIIYFFFRGRVNTGDHPSEVNEIARSYILLRPIEKTAKLNSGPIGDAGNSRLCAIPKKVLPQSGRDRWISFVEKCGVSFEQLKNEFLSSEEYMTVEIRIQRINLPYNSGGYYYYRKADLQDRQEVGKSRSSASPAS